MRGLAPYARTKSPWVKMPASLLSAVSRMQAPVWAVVIAFRQSFTEAVSGRMAISSPRRMMSLTLVSSARPREPPGWRLAKSRAVEWRASTRAMARASPMTSMAVVLEVGARFSGQASRETPVSSTMSEYLAREEAVLPVMEMMGSSKRLMKGSRASSSEVSPEKDIAMQTSPSWTMPRSPCRAFRESSRTVGVPVEFRVATILAPMLPDLPTPTMTILLPRSRAWDMSSTAWLKLSSSRDRTPRSSSISISKTDLARVK